MAYVLLIKQLQNFKQIGWILLHAHGIESTHNTFNWVTSATACNQMEKLARIESEKNKEKRLALSKQTMQHNREKSSKEHR